ncbi:McbB family protein [Mesorhizobium huakuii]|uniref:McbB family protein n=1 Tax=Mesorhizobium huakuii TaxID=28104 RepID=A0A7G6T4X1_9HYPH|nr:McbB family protein [Mesorhizobium huakuii]QND61803.1 McbB family protein [Mesorhizobium huakuii]QND69041.1 McbB family protein [Mesorhizobium loti]
MYTISPFVLEPADIDGVCKLFTPTGAASISDANLAAALREFSSIRPYIDEHCVSEILERNALPIDAAEQFLTKLKVLRRMKSDESVVIYCASDEISRSLGKCIENNDAITCTSIDDLALIGNPTFLVAIQAAYSSTTAREIYAACARSPECIVLHAYFVFRHFVIDGFYSASMGLPDHFSGLHNLAGLDRNPGFKPTSWADFFLSDPYALNSLSVPTFAALEIEAAAALHLLYTRLRPLLADGVAPLFPDDLSTIIEMNLDTGRIERHRGAHSTYSAEPRTI